MIADGKSHLLHLTITLFALATLLLGCGTKDGSPPGEGASTMTATGTSGVESGATAETMSAGATATGPSTTGEAAPSATVTIQLPKPAIPILTPEDFTGKNYDKIFPIEGAIIVTRGTNIGRIVSDGVLWIGKLPAVDPAFANIASPSVVIQVKGRWPDRVDVIYVADSGAGRVTQYLPLTGKGNAHQANPGRSRIEDVITVRDSTVLITVEDNEYKFVTVRGPELSIMAPNGADASGDGGAFAPLPKIYPLVFSSSPSGTLMTVSGSGSKGEPVAWVWNGPGKSRIIPLGQWLKEEDSILHEGHLHVRELLRGAGDELWLDAGRDRPILHYKDGKFEQVPTLAKPIERTFVSSTGQLHATDGQVFYRLEADNKWKPIAELPWSMELYSVAIHDGAFWSGFTRLRENGGWEARDRCTTPFVYLYEVKSGTPTDFTFPETRKALLSFPELSGLTLVEFDRSRRRKLGIEASSNAQGLAVIAHIKETRKDENPVLLCFNTPDPRRIDIKAGDK